MTDDRFTPEEHERARLAGEQLMAKLAGKQPAAAAAAASSPAKRDKTQRFPYLGVIIRDGAVFKDGNWRLKRLGPLAGARAQLGDVGKVHNVGAAALTLMPVFALTTRRQATAYIVFPDGTVHERKLDGKTPVRKGESEVVKFNALVAAAG
jgi:hypothetical protein